MIQDPEGYHAASVAQKMSWAARRGATREEDVAYSLFGIFGVNMAPLYGEGAASSFRRLQEEIIWQGADDTILSWSTHGCQYEVKADDGGWSILAPSPGLIRTHRDVLR